MIVHFRSHLCSEYTDQYNRNRKTKNPLSTVWNFPGICTPVPLLLEECCNKSENPVFRTFNTNAYQADAECVLLLYASHVTNLLIKWDQRVEWEQQIRGDPLPRGVTQVCAAWVEIICNPSYSGEYRINFISSLILPSFIILLWVFSPHIQEAKSSIPFLSGH